MNGRWCVPALLCILAIACSAGENTGRNDPSPGNRGGSSGAGGGGGSAGAATAGTSGSGNTGGVSSSGGNAGSSGGGSGGSGGTAGTAGTAGSAGTTMGAGGDPATGGAGGDPAMGGSGGDPAMGGSGGDPAMGGSGGDPAVGGSGGDPAMGGAGGAGATCNDDNLKSAGESHIDCNGRGTPCPDCAFALTRYVIGDTGNMGTVTMTWDNTNLYYFFDIIDNTPQNDSADHWEDDSVEIYLDLNNGKTATYQGDDHQITLGRGVTTIQGLYGDAQVGQIMVMPTTDANGYTLDVTIPWSALGMGAPAGQDIGFDFAVNNDTNGGTRESQITVFGTVNNYNNTSAFGTITLN